MKSPKDLHPEGRLFMISHSLFLYVIAEIFVEFASNNSRFYTFEARSIHNSNLGSNANGQNRNCTVCSETSASACAVHEHIILLLLSPMIHNDIGYYIAECRNICNLMSVFWHGFNNTVIAIIITFIEFHISHSLDLVSNQTIGASFSLRFIDKSFNVSIIFIDLEKFYRILECKLGKKKENAHVNQTKFKLCQIFATFFCCIRDMELRMRWNL